MRAFLKMVLPQFIRDGFHRFSVYVLDKFHTPIGSAEYWTRNHVDAPSRFETVEQSLDHYAWRNCLYPGQMALMPVFGADALTVLDYGCGPGNDIIGFMHASKPARMIAVDVSPTALALARARTDLHQFSVEFHQIPESPATIPLDSTSVDLVHSAGVIHHIPDPLPVLREIHRVLKPTGHAQIMVYHRDSIWMHLFVAYEILQVRRFFPGLSKEQAFPRTTDGTQCPVAYCYTAEEFSALAAQAGFRTEFRGAAMSVLELERLSQRWAALRHKGLDRESREFLADLTFDERNFPMRNKRIAGINGCYILYPN